MHKCYISLLLLSLLTLVRLGAPELCVFFFKLNSLLYSQKQKSKNWKPNPMKALPKSHNPLTNL